MEVGNMVPVTSRDSDPALLARQLLDTDYFNMNEQLLSDLLDQAQSVYAALEENEPEADEESEEYGEWLNLLEELESMCEDVEEMLEE